MRFHLFIYFPIFIFATEMILAITDAIAAYDIYISLPFRYFAHSRSPMAALVPPHTLATSPASSASCHSRYYASSSLGLALLSTPTWHLPYAAPRARHAIFASSFIISHLYFAFHVRSISFSKIPILISFSSQALAEDMPSLAYFSSIHGYIHISFNISAWLLLRFRVIFSMIFFCVLAVWLPQGIIDITLHFHGVLPMLNYFASSFLSGQLMIRYRAATPPPLSTSPNCILPHAHLYRSPPSRTSRNTSYYFIRDCINATCSLSLLVLKIYRRVLTLWCWLLCHASADAFDWHARDTLATRSFFRHFYFRFYCHFARRGTVLSRPIFKLAHFRQRR